MSPEVPVDRIRVQRVREKPTEMWGFVWVNQLPFCFRAWYSPYHKNTGWGFVHAPYEPLSFTPPIFTTDITKDDMAYLLRKLRVRRKRIKRARQDGNIPELFRATLESRQTAYQEFTELYTKDAELRKVYGTAIRKACDQREIQLHTSS